MELSHFLGALILLILLIISLLFRNSFIIHICCIFVDIWMVVYAIINEWEIFFFPIFVLCGLSFLALVVVDIKNGSNWI